MVAGITGVSAAYARLARSSVCLLEKEQQLPHRGSVIKGRAEVQRGNRYAGPCTYLGTVAEEVFIAPETVRLVVSPCDESRHVCSRITCMQR